MQPPHKGFPESGHKGGNLHVCLQLCKGQAAQPGRMSWAEKHCTWPLSVGKQDAVELKQVEDKARA